MHYIIKTRPKHFFIFQLLKRLLAEPLLGGSSTFANMPEVFSKVYEILGVPKKATRLFQITKKLIN